MRRFIAIILMFIVPLQFAWSAVESVHGHMDNEGSLSRFHFHDDDHDHLDVGAIDGDGFSSVDTADAHSDSEHHGGHFHHIFSTLLIETNLKLGEAQPNGPPIRPPASFTSHIPLLIDRPPLTLL